MERQSSCSFLSHSLHSSSIRLGIAAVLAITIPSAPAVAISIRGIPEPTNYRLCAERLLRAGIAPNTLATACAGALRPQDLSSCVLKIKLRTPIAAQDALSACSQVRRPNDLSTCVLDINSGTKSAVATDVLDYCRRSLLPVSFSECVVSLNRTIDISTARALDTCFDTAFTELPRSPYRTYVPLVLPPLPTAAPPQVLPPLPQGQVAPPPGQITPPPGQITPPPTAP